MIEKGGGHKISSLWIICVPVMMFAIPLIHTPDTTIPAIPLTVMNNTIIPVPAIPHILGDIRTMDKTADILPGPLLQNVVQD